MILSLNGNWEFKAVDQDKWLPAIVPGSNFLDLINNAVIEHPYMGTNEKDVQWVAKKDWQYRRDFEVDRGLIGSDIIEIVFKGLDTLASVFINDNLVICSANGLRRHSADIKPFIKEGKNTILITFLSPVNYIMQKNKILRFPNNMNGLNGVSHIRKNQSHFGWDWGPILPPSGIVDDVYIVATNSAKIADVYIRQRHDNDKVRLDIQLDTHLYAKDKDIDASIKIIAPNGEQIISKNIKVVSSSENLSLEIANPVLWFCNGLTPDKEQPLYNVKITLTEDSQEIDTRDIIIGLRTIELDRSKDQWGNKFQFVVNGYPIFAKGANWIPQDSIKRLDRAGLERLVLSMRDCNMNMIRVWGGGYYESDYFYDLCDRYGILVWQDFCFACMPYDFDDEDFLNNLKDEVIDNVLRLRNRASLAIWCGNNEIELLSNMWMYRRRLIKSTGRFFYEILPEWLKDLDSERPYWPGSPASGEYLKSVNSDDIGDTHLWQVWHGLRPYDYYRNRYTRFCSEFGFESFPDMKTIQSFHKNPNEDYSITSDTMLAHQKCNSGNQKILFYASLRFRIPKRFQDIVYISQVTQMECIRDATEHWRRNRDRCYGALYWQLNDCWPVSSWASIDYYGRWKALQYAARRFNAPIAISIQDDKNYMNVSIVNDTTQDITRIVEWGIMTYQGEEIVTGEINAVAHALTAKTILTKDCKDYLKRHSKDIFFYARIKGDDSSIRTSLFDKEKNTNLRKPKINIEIEKTQDKYNLYLESDCYVRFACIDVAGYDRPLSDNYMDLIPNYRYKVEIDNADKAIKELELRDITITTLNNIEPKQSKFRDSLYRLYVRLLPMNIINAIGQNLNI